MINILHKYMLEKNKIFEELLGEKINYYTEEDKNLLNQIDIKIVPKIIRKIKESLEHYMKYPNIIIIKLIEDELCPFCLYIDDDYEDTGCINCAYGKKKGFCDDTNSIYHLLRTKMPKKVTPEIRNKVKKYLKRLLDAIYTYQCNVCIHNHVCKKDMEQFCKNFKTWTVEFESCFNCKNKEECHSESKYKLLDCKFFE